jgi:hypothetical protein
MIVFHSTMLLDPTSAASLTTVQRDPIDRIHLGFPSLTQFCPLADYTTPLKVLHGDEQVVGEL